MTKLPTDFEMKEALIKSGVLEFKIWQEIAELEQRKPIYRKNRQLAFKYLCDKHNVDLDINYGRSGIANTELTLVNQIDPNDQIINMRGYILYITDPRKTSTGSGIRVSFSFIDETGSISIGVNQIEDDLVDRLIAEIDSFPKPVLLKGVTISTFKDRLTYGIPNWENCGWEIIGETDYGLPPFKSIIETLPKTNYAYIDNNFYILHGYIADKKLGNGYIGCPYCRKGLKVHEGIQVNCACGRKVIAKKYPATHVLLIDEVGELEVTFPAFSNVSLLYVRELCEADIQPEVLIGARKTEKYGMSGSWIVPLGEVKIDKGTGKTVTVGTLDQLDFSKDKDRNKFTRFDDESVDTAEIEPYVLDYIDTYCHLNEVTPDYLAGFIKVQCHTDYEVEMKPIIEELLSRELIKITADKISPNNNKIQEMKSKVKKE